ncbi:tetratricopeptide repeat protein [Pontibacter silvestris]|uniref:Tetratricopeptide repeat protein n=1 Tax=Pontibacter silvestris TaxID=2305183 RepID=A0ABW4WXQ8_9BACT|nr:tetratricopeptide repeat protein [Pontibacter silvestris]MCC9137679.1 tetratricopeptide repeat protein [Pontibacter silvestris]
MKRTILLFYLIAVVFVAHAQTKLLFEEASSKAYLMKSATAGNSSQQSINSIISLLSNEEVKSSKGGRPNRKPEFVVRFEQQARIADTGDKLQLKVQLNKVAISGDINYKGFDLGEVLLPEKLSYIIQLLNEQDKEVQSYRQSVKMFDKGSFVVFEMTVPDTAASQRYKLKVVDKELVYTSKSVRQVKEYMELVRAYYVADAALAKTLQDIAYILPDDIDQLTQHEHNLRKLEDAFAFAKEAPFWKKLNLRQNDPLRLTSKINEVETQLQERRRAINHIMATLDMQFYNRGTALFTKGDYKAARAYFAKSLEVNPTFSPSHLQLARLDFINGFVQEAAARTRELVTVMRTDPETAASAMTLAQDIYSTFITQGNNLTTSRQYEDALSAYADARDLCSTIRGLRCNMMALNDGEARAAYGLYRDIIEDGKNSLAHNDLAKAERLAEEALDFQQQYDFVLHNAREASDLVKQVKYRFYLQAIDKGKLYLAQNNYDAALGQFEAALGLEASYTLTPVKELASLAQKAAKPVLLAMLTSGYQQAIDNVLPNARAVASEAIAMQARFALEQDREVQIKYDLLRKRIFTQECINTQAAYDKHFHNAKELIRDKKFISADLAYQAAIKVSEDNADCNIATFTAKDGHEAIAAAVAYQRMLEDINRFVASSRYTEAIETYSKAEKYYLAYEVNRFGLDNTSLFDFAHDSKKFPFTAAVVSHFAALGEEQTSIDLLTSLLDKGYSKGKTKKVQQQLGKQLAAKDAQRDLTEQPKVVASNYTSGHKSLKKLSKAYEKELKRLLKQ